MSIATYAELQTAVSNWLHRADVSSHVPDFIKMGEALLNRKLRTVDMETRATSTLSTSTRFMAMPTGMLEIQSMFIQNPASEVVFLEPYALREYVESETASGMPSHFTVKEDIEFNCVPDSAYVVELHYFKKYDIATDLSNWLLTNYPELYLHSALSAAALFIRDNDLLAASKGLVNEGVAEINDQEARKRGAHLGYMRVDDNLLGSRKEHITTG